MWFSIYVYKRPFVKLEIHKKIKIHPSVVVDIDIYIVHRIRLNSVSFIFFSFIIFFIVLFLTAKKEQLLE